VQALGTYLRSLDPGLPRPVWLVQAGGVVNSLGNGMALPFGVIYLHNVRGISFAVAGFALAFGGAVSLVSGLSAGSIVDRVGGRNTLLVGLLLQSGAFLLFPLIHHPWQAFALLGIEGAGTACFWPGQSTLLSRLTPEERRHHTYALQRISMNLGMGLGGVVGGLIATTAHPSSFTALFRLDSATFLVFVLVLATVREPRVSEPEAGAPAGGGYREVLRDRAFLGLIGLNVVFVTVGYELFALLPAFAKNEAGVNERWIGLIWLANTLLIVITQLPVSKALEGRRRMRALALMNLLWAVAALIVAGTGAWLTASAAALFFILATMIFGVGETLQGPTQAPLTADLAPERLRGRYFALGSMSWSLGGVLGPAIGGPLLGWHPLLLWPVAAATCVLAGGGCLVLERAIPPALRRTPKTSNRPTDAERLTEPAAVVP
jgi:MFS family permease